MAIFNSYFDNYQRVPVAGLCEEFSALVEPNAVPGASPSPPDEAWAEGAAAATSSCHTAVPGIVR